MARTANCRPSGSGKGQAEQGDEPFCVDAMDSAAFSRAAFPREWLIRQILVQGQPAVIGGPKKALKTSFLVDAAVSLGSATPFLGCFAVPRRRRVAVFSGESGEAALQDTARRVCAARGVSLGDCAVHWSFRLPCLCRPGHRQALGRFLREEGIEVACLDPLYLCLLDGGRTVSASNLYEVGPLLWQAARACLDAGATPVFVHHATKTAGRRAAGPGEALDLDDLAFSGVAEFARQWILVSRREPFEPGSGRHRLVLAAGGSAGHAGRWDVLVEEGSAGVNLTGRHWLVKVRAAAGEHDHPAGTGGPHLPRQQRSARGGPEEAGW
jgi:replicative DNA helicase